MKINLMTQSIGSIHAFIFVEHQLPPGEYIAHAAKYDVEHCLALSVGTQLLVIDRDSPGRRQLGRACPLHKLNWINKVLLRWFAGGRGNVKLRGSVRSVFTHA